MSFGIFALPGHSVAHILQLTHNSATARKSSSVASVNPRSRSERNRLAFARGAANSECVARKIGHIRWAVSSVRHAPQPLQEDTAVVISSGAQTSSGVDLRDPGRSVDSSGGGIAWPIAV